MLYPLSYLGTKSGYPRHHSTLWNLGLKTTAVLWGLSVIVAGVVLLKRLYVPKIAWVAFWVTMLFTIYRVFIKIGWGAS